MESSQQLIFCDWCISKYQCNIYVAKTWTNWQQYNVGIPVFVRTFIRQGYFCIVNLPLQQLSCQAQ